MIVLTDSNGDEHLIPDSQLTGLFTELRDLLQRQRSEATKLERERCAGIVESLKAELIDNIWGLDGERIGEIVNDALKEINEDA